jgi:hypothetical protein
MSEHFQGKDPLSHVREKRQEGMLSISEVHGTEMPGHFSAAADAGKETAIVLLLVWLFLDLLRVPHGAALSAFIAFGIGWVAWKGGRSGRLGWQKLERLHRLIEQEKYEIEHHRHQEREELMALYQAKGFEGKLLDEVVDVLMADQDRLLKVMLEEEMGLTLQAYEHPLQQTIGALVGSAISLAVAGLFFFFLPAYGMWIATWILLAAASIIAAAYEKNKVIPALIWDISLAALAFRIAFFLFKILT